MATRKKPSLLRAAADELGLTTPKSAKRRSRASPAPRPPATAGKPKAGKRRG